MPKDNEICLDHFDDLIDDSSPLKSLIDRRILPYNDKRVKIVGTKRPDVRDFFSHFNDPTQVDQENVVKNERTKSEINNRRSTPTSITSTPEGESKVKLTGGSVGFKETKTLVKNNHKNNINKNHNNNHINNIYSQVNDITNVGYKVETAHLSLPSSSSSSTLSSSSSSPGSSTSSIDQINDNTVGAIGIVNTTSTATIHSLPASLKDSSTLGTISSEISANPINSTNKLDKRLTENDGGFKFIKWTANHRGYKINPSNKRSTWFSDSTRDNDESATIVSLKIKSTDPVIGESYHHFFNQNAYEPKQKPTLTTTTSIATTKQDNNNKLSSSVGMGEQFIRGRSNSSPEAKGSNALVNSNSNRKFSSETKSIKCYNNDSNDVAHLPKDPRNEINCNNNNNLNHTNHINSNSNHTSEKKRIGEIIRNLLRRRPTLDEIREKGILIDGPVFGCDLTSLCNREGQLVPKISQYCIEAIEAKGLQTDGLYRICGNLSEVQKIRFQVNHGNYDTIWSQENVHALTGVLKLFLRDLKEPLLPFDLFNSFIFAIGIPNKKDQIEALHQLVNQLPKCNYHTLVFLLKHLLRVVQYQDKNRMQIQNLSIIFGPTLMWPRTESNDFSYDMMLRVHCNRIVEILLTEFNAIFMVPMNSVPSSSPSSSASTIKLLNS